MGTALGVWTFTLLRSLGQLDLLIALSYVILLSTVGGLMFWEGLRAILRARRGVAVPMRRSGSHGWIHGLPLKMRFKRSKIYLSVIPVVVVGLIIGFIGAVMGIGGGFILIPIMIYLLRVPTSTVIGTSMVLTLVTMVFATMLHAVTNHLVDAVLALILMVGGVTGAQFGARAGQKIRGEHLRLLLGHLIRNRRHCAAAEHDLRRDAGARGAADRVGLQSPRHRDAELFRRRTRPVRLGRKGCVHAAQPQQLRSRGDGLWPARRHGDAAQGAQIRHLGQHRLPAVSESADLPGAVFQPAVRRHRFARGRAAAAARSQQCAAHPARRARLRRRGAERCVPQRLRAAAFRTWPLSRGNLRGDLPDADAVSHRHSASGRGADRNL